MKLRKVLALVLVLAIAVTAFAGCAGGTTSSTSSASTESSAAVESTESTESTTDTSETSTESEVATTSGMYPGTSEANAITLNLGTEPPELNSLTMTYSISFSVLRHIMENLVMLDENDNVIPGVAETWEISDDGLNYTFHLREGMTWTNGEPVTAHDFTFAWEQLLTPGVGGEYAYFGFIFKNAEAFYNGDITSIDEVGFKAADDYTLEVTLENPTAYALFLFSFGSLAPVNEKYFNEVGADKYMSEAEYFNTNGAFNVTSWTHDSNIVLEKNANFYKASDVSLDKITFVMLNTTDSALNSFRASEVDMVGLSGDQMTIMEGEGYPYTTYSDGAEFHVLFNTKNQYLSNVNLRKAIDLAYSREAYINAILKDASVPALSFTNPGVSGADGTSFAGAVEAAYGQLNNTAADSEKAKEYLAKALEELGVTVEELSANLSMNCGDSDTATQQAAFFQEQLRTNLGIEISIKSMTTKAQSEARRNRDYVMDFTGWGPDYNDPMTFLDMWVTDGGNNSTDWSNARYDELIKLAASETDAEKRQEYFLECEKILNDEAPISCTYWRNRTYVVSEKITGGYWRTAFQDINFVYATVK